MRKVLLAMACVVVTGSGFAQQPWTATPAPDAKPAGASEAKPAGPAPVISIIEKVKDFGTVAKGEKIKATFAVKNEGQGTLEITQVRPTCGCTVANFDRSVPPGGSGKIDAEVDTSSFSGPITKAVLVYSNDPANPQVNLVIKAEVRAFIEVLPRNLIRFNVLQGEAATEKVTLTAFDAAPFQITGVDAGTGPYEVSYREIPEKDRTPEQKGQWEVAVTVPANAAEGMLNHKINIKTTAPKASDVTLTVSGVVRPIVQVIPSEINFGRVTSAAPVGRNIILVNNRQGATLEVASVEVDNPNFKAEVIPLQAGQRFQVAVQLASGVKGNQKGVLRIATNDPARKLIEVPIQADAQ